MQHQEWWNDFFDEPWFDVQRNLWPDDVTALEKDLIARLLGLNQSDRVLDVPCGDGRHAVLLAADGFKVTAMELKESALEEARKRAAESNVEVRWIQGDIRDLPMAETFDAAYCYWGSFGYFDDQANEDFVSAIAEMLPAGGKFLVNTHCLESIVTHQRNPHSGAPYQRWYQAGDTFVAEERQYDVTSGRVTAKFTLIRDGNVNRIQSSVRFYSCPEIRSIFERLGFKNVEFYTSGTLQPFEIGSPYLTLVATRQ